MFILRLGPFYENLSCKECSFLDIYRQVLHHWGQPWTAIADSYSVVTATMSSNDVRWHPMMPYDTRREQKVLSLLLHNLPEDVVTVAGEGLGNSSVAIPIIPFWFG